jgi:hypothetical protein
MCHVLAACIFLCLCHVTGPVLLVLVNCMCFVVKVCINSNKCIFIIVKTKCVNSSNIDNNICGNLNFILKYTYFTITDIYLSKITYILQFFTSVVGS